MLASAYFGSIWHHGIKGQKWGIRRTQEQLGHTVKTDVAKPAESGIIEEKEYVSSKEFSIRESKFSGYCLKPGAKHADHFLDRGYKETDSEKLFSDIEAGFDLSKKFDVRKVSETKEKFSIPIMLGVTKKSLFRTVWQKDVNEDYAKFVTAYYDSSLSGED